MQPALQGLTILGTDTEVGKTYVACCILASLRSQGIKVAAYKPVASGVDTVEGSDGYRLWIASGKRGDLTQVNPQCFSAPLAPPVAARLEERSIDEARVFRGATEWAGKCDFLVVEGAGGLMSPISWTMTNATLSSRLGFPILLVTANRLGVVNQVLTTLAAAQALDLDVRWVVLNDNGPDLSLESNQELLEVFLKQSPKPPKVLRLKQGGIEFDPPLHEFDVALGP